MSLTALGRGAALAVTTSLVSVWLPTTWFLVPIVQALSTWSAVAVVVLVVFEVVRRRRGWAPICAGLVAALAASVLVTHASSGPPDCEPSRAVDRPATTMRILSTNTLQARATGIPAAIERIDPDIVVMLEANERLAERVREAVGPGRFAYRAASSGTGGEAAATIVLSRFPIRQAEQLAGSDSLGMEVRTPSGVVHLVAVHPLPPLPGWQHLWSTALAGVRTEIASVDPDEPLIVAGDFNATRGHPTFRTLSTGLDEAIPTLGGLRTTWPDLPWGLGVAPIDHVLTRHLCRGAAGVEPMPGSDHRLVWAELGL